MHSEIIRGNLDKIRTRIDKAAKKSGRQAEDIKAVVVTKYVGADVIDSLSELGVTDIGENRVGDAVEKSKIKNQKSKFVWHMVGHLQTNKVKKALEVFDVLHSLDSIHLANILQKELAKANKVLLAFIEVNTSEEKTKGGITPDQLKDFTCQIQEKYKNIRLMGLMTMAPEIDNPEKVRPYFGLLRELKEKVGLKSLSMGMTNDFEIAIEEGADVVRIGRAVFEGII